MITPLQANTLARLAKDLGEAMVADSWKGGGDPEDIPELERRLEEAKKRFNAYLNHLIQPKAFHPHG